MDKTVILFTLLVLLLTLFHFSIKIEAQGTLVASGSNSNIELNTGQSLAFQSDNTLVIRVTEDSPNRLLGVNANLKLWDRRGSFSFYPVFNSTLEISSPDAEEGYAIVISGADSKTQTDHFTWIIDISTGNTVSILWNWRIESWIGKYTLFALGFSGIGLMVASPTWVALMIRKKGLNADSFERMMYAMLLFCVGFGLMVMWLWG